jgi:ribosomal protein S18 acetylase RimI-like enzyme
MLVSQRGTSFSANTSEIYTIDRFKTELGSGFDFDTTITQENDTPDGFQKSLKVTPDATKSVSGSDNAGIYTLLEGQDLQDFKSGTSEAKKIVYSFFAKSGSSNSGHQYSVFLRLRNGSNFYKQVRSFTVTSSWQRFSFAFDLDTSTNQIGTAATDACFFGCWLVCGPDDLIAETTSWTGTTSQFLGANGQSNFMDNTSNEFFITGVQLEISDSGVATDFEHRSFGQELALCQRYFQTAPADTLMVFNNNTASWLFPSEMRATPSMGFIGLSGSGAALAATKNGFRQSAANSQTSGIGYTAAAEL